MRPKKELIKEGLYNESLAFSRAHIARFYRDQLDKFAKIGLGKETENGVRITENLIAITKARLNQLKPIIFSNISTNGTHSAD